MTFRVEVCFSYDSHNALSLSFFVYDLENCPWAAVEGSLAQYNVPCRAIYFHRVD